MQQGSEGSDPLAHTFAQSALPIYIVDAQRRLLYANQALGDWLEIPHTQLVGEQTSYHGDSSTSKLHATVLGLAPPPSAHAGQARTGTISCVGKGGGLRHRRADFIPLIAHAGESPLLVIVEPQDLTSQELAATLSPAATPDRFHAALVEWRRTHLAPYAESTLLGISPGIRRAADQARGAAASGQNVLVTGPAAADLQAVAEAVHYLASPTSPGQLLRIEPRLGLHDELRRALVAGTAGRGTLLLLGAADLAPHDQEEMAAQIAQSTFQWRVVATLPDGSMPPLLPALDNVLSTIQVRVPPLAERLEDLPLLAQWHVEQLNRNNPKQLEGFSPDAIERMSLYDWPGEQEELYEVIATSHARAKGPYIEAADLPSLLQHAVSHAQHLRTEVEPIDLDHYLKQVEELFLRRAMDLARGNKAEAARLLGLNRPRLYRKLEQLEGTSTASPPRKPSPPPQARPVKEPPAEAKEEIEFFPLDSAAEEDPK